MTQNMLNEKVIDFERVCKEPKVRFNIWPRMRAVLLKLMLGGLDFSLAFLSFIISSAAMELLAGQSMTLNHWASLLVFAIMVIIFFPAQHLYSRHLIFSKRKHMARLLIAFTSSFLSFSLVVAVFALPVVAKHYSLFLIALVVISMICSSRFAQFENRATFYLLKIFGISMLAIGILGILYKDRTSDIFNHSEMVVYGFCLAVAALFVARLGIVSLLFNSSLKRHFRRQVAVVGSDEQGRNIVSYIIDRNAPFWVAGTIGEQYQLDVKIRKHCLGTLEELPEIVSAHKIDELLIADQDLDKLTLVCILDYCLSHGIPVWFPPSFLEIIDRKLYIDKFCGLPMIRLCSPKRIWLVNKIKHAVDAVISLPLFVMLLPLFGVIAAAIKLTSPGPVFYKAKAIGKGGREFNMYKFRSMRMNNDAQIHKNYVTKLIKGEIDNSDDKSKPLKITNDPRVTKVGNILRKLSLDELPQLINVIKGDMSLVGPRPCLPYEFEVYKDWYKRRASIRPGITGLWQVAGRSEVTFEDMILLDLYYVYNRSLWLDLNILTETAFVVLEKRGAY
jgi:exopolysaccharide biosynthesis polyprenyl glycosylphosphotransferase